MFRIVLSVLILTMTVSAAVQIEKVSYKGWPNCYRVTNGEIELILTSDVGPRVMRFGFVGGQNIFKEYADQLGKTGEKEFQLRGGHRLWVAPEHLATSWAPDNVPVKIAIKGSAIEATEPVEPTTGIQKQITIEMDPDSNRVRVVHRILNTTPWTLELAPWGLTMLAQGGTEIVGFPPRGKHPEVLLPTNPLVMWAYTDFSDPRWQFNKKHFLLRQNPKVGEPQKVGIFNPNTWAAYLLGSDLFVKRATADPSRTYPDFGCSFETFTNTEFLEMETLGPMTKVEPGASVEHVETWSLKKNVKVASWSDDEIDRILRP